MSPSKTFLFVHSSGPTHVHSRDEAVKTNIRRHVMVDIGKSRRKRPRNPEANLKVMERINSRNTRANQELESFPLRYAFWDQHPLVALEMQWGMDMFSAYAIAFLVSEGRSRALNDGSTGGFWFPFAFRASEFLKQFKSVMTSPEMVAAVSRAPEKKFRVLALERSLGTVSCLQGILNGTSLVRMVTNSVIRAVVACICYNLVSLDYTQARIHVKGLERVIAARGGLESLHDDEDLRLMIFWVDVTASLLYNSRPRFTQPFDLLPETELPGPAEALPTDLLKSMKGSSYAPHIILCLRDLQAAVPHIEAEISSGENMPWRHEEHIGLRLNPIAHRLLAMTHTSEYTAHADLIADALRLGQIVWIILIKRVCRAYPGSASPYALRLLRLLSDRAIEQLGLGFLPARFWLLVLCVFGCSGTDREKMAVDLLRRMIREQRLTSWNQITVHVCQMPWVNVLNTVCAGMGRTLFE
ncbi:hypothetical protein BJX99DRAFT_264842 [Aspergillus californicus]